MEGPNFYSIDFSREQVLQGKSTTFVTIARNDDGGMENDEILYIIPFVSTKTFNCYATANVEGGIIDIGDNLTLNSVKAEGFFTDEEKLSFNNISKKLVVKNGHLFLPNGVNNIGPVIVKNVEKSYATDIDYYLSLTTDPSELNLNLDDPGSPFPTDATIHIGKWILNDGIHWKLNGKLVSEYENIDKNVNTVFEDDIFTFPNIFDGSIKFYNPDDINGILQGSGYVLRNSEGWCDIKWDSKLPNKSISFRIDFDGEIDSHIKINFLIFRKTTDDINDPTNSVRTPLKVRESHFGGNNVAGSYLSEPFGVKSGKDGDEETISNYIDYQELHIFGYKQENFITSKDTWPNELPTKTYIHDDLSSYSVLKTNPKLSGNIKLTLDSSNNLWLNSIDANNELADSSYKKFPVSPKSTFSKDLYSFLKNGQTPTSILYDLFQLDSSYENTKRELYQQYDNFYNYGVEQLKSKFYDENFSFFAPIWLRKNIPSYFIIFRVDGPIYPESYSTISNEVFFETYLKDSKIIKTFDMREGSNLGIYLRKIVDDTRFKDRPLDISFDVDVPTVWNGVSYKDGTMTGKSEFLFDYWSKDRPILELEEYISTGFERHGIISTNLINLEFLFDDEESSLYSINRYFGLYVNENELAKIEIYPNALVKTINQTPAPKPNIDGAPYSNKAFVQRNPDGIVIPVDYYHNTTDEINLEKTPVNPGIVIGKLPLTHHVDDSLRIFYIKDKEDNFKKIKKIEEIDYGNSGTTDYIRSTNIVLADNTETISNYTGVTEITSQLQTTLLPSGNSQLRIHLNKDINSDVIADEEELFLTAKKYNFTKKLHTYYLKVKSITGLNKIAFYVFKDQYTERLLSIDEDVNAEYTMPAIGAYLSNVKVRNVLKFNVGQLVYITNAGFFKVYEVNLNTSTITLQNNNNPTNIAGGEPISKTELISLGGPSFESIYDYSPLSNVLSIDTLLSILIVESIASYNLSDSYRIEIKDNEKTIHQNVNLDDDLPDTKNLDFKVNLPYQQYTWKLIANDIGLLPATSWSYPLENPNTLEYITTFNNKGTTSDVAKAITSAINSFENRLCDAVSIDNVIYLKEKTNVKETVILDFTRKMVMDQSNRFNVGFYEENHVKLIDEITYINFIGLNSYNININLIHPSIIYDITHYYINVEKYKFEDKFYFNLKIRTDVEIDTFDNVKITGIQNSYILDSLIFENELYPFELDFTSIPDPIEGEEPIIYDWVIKYEAGPGEINQQFVGDSITNRNRAKILSDDRERYYKNNAISIIISTELDSNLIISDDYDKMVIGSIITSEFLPAHTYVTRINKDTKTLTLSNVATNTSENSDAFINSFSILNNDLIRNQWFQSQKEYYSLLQQWNVQGKYIYSLPNLDEPVFNDKNEITGYNDLESYGIIQLMNNNEFYLSKDKRIISYDIYRPSVGIFSIFPIKTFDFDTYYSDYSYTPILEALRYYSNEKLKENEYLTLSSNENYKITVYDNLDTIILPSNTETVNYTLEIEGFNNEYKTWDYLDTITYYGELKDHTLIINTYYPFYVYDTEEIPSNWTYKIDEFPEGIGKRNFMKKIITYKKDDEAIELKPLFYRIKLTNVNATDFGYLKINKSDFSDDKDIKKFTGFNGITDIYTQEDAFNIRELLDKEKYIEAFLQQLLKSEYDRLRENFNKDFSLKSKVVPYINKWVQEGTDARDNFYRLNNSKSFGLTNFSPDYTIKKPETTLLTHEFPYLDSTPKEYPIESLESSRSYMFSRLSDIAYDNKSWYNLITTNLDNDWFLKYFSVGAPTDKNIFGDEIQKSREERFTFFKYYNGINRSQTLFRGAKIQVIDYNQNLDEENFDSVKYDGYKFSAIARILSPESFVKEKPIKIEVIKNEKYKTILLIINIYVQDYRINSGMYDYFFMYSAIDQLKNVNQKQSKFSVESINANERLCATHDIIGALSFNAFTPYSGTAVDITNYTKLATLRPRQGFLGGGYLELGDVKLGGVISEAGGSNPNKPIYYPSGIGSFTFESVNPLSYEFSINNEIIPLFDNYLNIENIYDNNILNIITTKFTENGSLFKLINTLSVANSNRIIQVDRSNSYEFPDQYLPLSLNFGTAQRPIKSDVNTGNSINNFKLTSNPTFIIAAQNPITLETFNLKGGTQSLQHIKTLLSFASIVEAFNKTEYVEYYNVENDVKTLSSGYKLQFIAPDIIQKTGMLAYINDNDKPIEYLGSPIIGYNIVDTNQNEVVWRHRGEYEPLSTDIIKFNVREDKSFSEHFAADFLLLNTRINNLNSYSGIIRNYAINKVASEEILKIKEGGAYKSLYPYVNEISIDKQDIKIFSSTWDNEYYKKYSNTKDSIQVPGILEMKEFKSFMGSKAMNTPKSQVLDTFNLLLGEIVYTINEPGKAISINSLSKKKTSVDNSVESKKILEITANIKDRLIRKILDDLNNPDYTDEFTNLLNVLNLETVLTTEFDTNFVNKLKYDYIEKNILNLYEISEINLYKKESENIVIFEPNISDNAKIKLGYRIDKDCKIVKLNDFDFILRKTLDSKKTQGFSLSVILKRI